MTKELFFKGRIRKNPALKSNHWKSSFRDTLLRWSGGVGQGKDWEMGKKHRKLKWYQSGKEGV